MCIYPNNTIICGVSDRLKGFFINISTEFKTHFKKNIVGSN